jgi:hypothetical protein
MLYRILSNLSVGKGILREGSISRLGSLKPRVLAILLDRGVIAPVAAPPLAVLPGWQHRAVRLAEIGVTGADHVLEGDVGRIAAHLAVSEELVRRWQTSLEQWLVAPAKQG